MDDRSYNNQELGVSLNGPKAWRLVSKKQFSESVSSQQLNLIDEEIEPLLDCLKAPNGLCISA